MKKINKNTGIALAAAAAGLLAAGCTTMDGAPHHNMHGTANVKCSGVNSCKGTSECQTATNACKSQNMCKGQGWVTLDEGECMNLGGLAVDR